MNYIEAVEAVFSDVFIIIRHTLLPSIWLLLRSGAVSVEPTHVEIIDEYGGRHRLDLRVLATDDTWAAPTLLAALVHGGIGSAIFSQVLNRGSPYIYCTTTSHRRKNIIVEL